MQTILLIGLGKIGLPVAQSLLSQGKNVIGVSRHLDTIFDVFKHYPNFTHIQANASQLTHIQHFSQAITHICIIVSPRQSGDQSPPEAYKNSYLAICENMVRLSPHFLNLQRIVFISSTSVYGQNAGEIVDINTPMQMPKSATAQILLQAETVLRQQFGEKCTIIRPSGIYGRERLRLVKMVENLAIGNNEVPQNTPTQNTLSENTVSENTWTNRIFDTDLIRIIVNVLNETTPLPMYIATDNMPVPMYEVLNFLAGEMGVKLNLPIILPTNLPTNGKRLMHNLPKNWLEYGDFKQGYQAILENFSPQ